jgi:dTDP-4-amino-4,6-dideoxy-D-galactose acyltransferase
MDEAVCQYLDWDSGFFRRRIGRVLPARLTQDTLTQIHSWADSQGVDTLYFLADAQDPATAKLAEQSGFHFVDIRLTLERPLNQLGSKKIGDALIRPWKEGDLPGLKAIAHVSHRDSRFYYDPTFTCVLCDAFYETWIERSCYGFAKQVLVAEIDQAPGGYVTCNLPAPDTGSIGLFAVAENAQGRGLGQDLIAAALSWFSEQGATQATVVTQGRNTRAQRVYQRCGFVTRSVQLWYHWSRRESLNGRR